MNEQTKADLIFYTDLYVDAGYDYEEAERMARDLLRVIGVIFDEDKVIWASGLSVVSGCLRLDKQLLDGMDMQLDNAYIQGMNMQKHRKAESQDLKP